MTELKEYSKPAMFSCQLRSSKRIANTCWGFHSGGSPADRPWWYDKNATQNGFVSFRIAPGDKCGELAGLLDVTWYQNLAALNNGNGIVVGPDDTVTTDDNQTVNPWQDTWQYLIDAGGNQGQSFPGENGLILDNKSMV